MSRALLATLVAIVAAVGALAADEDQTNRLSYNDGSAEGRKSLPGSGEIIAFSLPDETAKIAAIRIHGSRFGAPQPPKEPFTIYFLNEDLSKTIAAKTAPYAAFRRGQPKWVEIKFPESLAVPKNFWVALDFHAERSNGVYVSIDSSTDGAHSRVGLPDMETEEAKINGDWMIEAVLTK